MLLDLLTVAVLAWFGSRLVVSFRRALTGPARARSVAIARGLRPRHFVPIPFVLTAVVAAALALTALPLLSFGWWTAIGGQGNPVFGVTDRTAGSALSVFVPIVFLVLLVPALPLLVETEERMFRQGAEAWSWPRRVGKVVLFGLAHALIGIPIGFALALSIGGAWFMAAYLHRWHRTGSQAQAVLESSRCHLAYNASIVTVVAVTFAVSLAAWVAGSV
ncbi:MAG TPA: hypothetical protein VHN98_03730 [Acidimicrobiales bacterium]|nr:hypothetical protein [Acidimicrobiales bacterium]